MLTRDFEPFFFGPPDGQLYGCSLTPETYDGAWAVIVCAPLGGEHVQGHRALRELAVRCASTGSAVLRFDYYGCGDSGGGSDEGRTARWVSDVAAAVDVARDRYRPDRVCLVGVRLGASLATIAATRATTIDSLVLWDPVVSGATYIAGLEESDEKMTATEFVAAPARHADGRELLGFPLSTKLEADLQAIDLLKIETAPAPRVLIVDGQEGGESQSLATRLRQLDVDVELARTPDATDWSGIVIEGRTLLPRAALQPVLAWIEGLPR